MGWLTAGPRFGKKLITKSILKGVLGMKEEAMTFDGYVCSKCRYGVKMKGIKEGAEDWVLCTHPETFGMKMEKDSSVLDKCFIMKCRMNLINIGKKEVQGKSVCECDTQKRMGAKADDDRYLTPWEKRPLRKLESNPRVDEWYSKLIADLTLGEKAKVRHEDRHECDEVEGSNAVKATRVDSTGLTYEHTDVRGDDKGINGKGRCEGCTGDSCECGSIGYRRPECGPAGLGTVSGIKGVSLTERNERRRRIEAFKHLLDALGEMDGLWGLAEELMAKEVITDDDLVNMIKAYSKVYCAYLRINTMIKEVK